MKVKDILANKKPGIITIDPAQSIHVGCGVLAEHNIGVLVAVDTEGLPVGILSERDIVRRLATGGPDTLNLTIGDLMTTNIITATPDDDLKHISTIMTTNRIRHLPILDDGKPVGMVSIGDVVKAQLSLAQSEARELERYITGERA